MRFFDGGFVAYLPQAQGFFATCVFQHFLLVREKPFLLVEGSEVFFDECFRNVRETVACCQQEPLLKSCYVGEKDCPCAAFVGGRQYGPECRVIVVIVGFCAETPVAADD